MNLKIESIGSVQSIPLHGDDGDGDEEDDDDDGDGDEEDDDDDGY